MFGGLDLSWYFWKKGSVKARLSTTYVWYSVIEIFDLALLYYFLIIIGGNHIGNNCGGVGS